MRYEAEEPEDNGRGSAGPSKLDACAGELIHVPGSIQPYGVFLALREPGLTVAQASENTADVFGIDARELTGTPVSRLLDRESMRLLAEAAGRSSMRRANPLSLAGGGAQFDGILHRSDGSLVVELEPRGAEDARPDELLDEVLESIDRLQATPTITALCQVATEEIGRLTGFDRSMIYRFHADEHGEVIAESRDPAMEPYLHLHYPASDIPAQARRLYTINRSRLIVDVAYRPAAIVPPQNPLTGRALDLSWSVLRSVSPIHIQYLRNMGVRASMSISLIRDGALWGLIACHHRSPRHVPYRRRMAGEFLGQVLSWQIETKEQQAYADAVLRAGATRSRLVEAMSTERDLGAGLTAGSPTIADLVAAGGVAIRDHDRWICLGETPPPDVLDEIAGWLKTRIRDGLYATDFLSRDHPPFEAVRAVASGVLAIAFPDAPLSLVLWFRPEVERTVRWAGDPRQQPTPSAPGARLEPRKSFRAWLELVRLRSAPWQPWEIDAARELRGAVIATVLTRAAELERLNRELEGAVRARDDFMSMASHELRTPIFTLGLQVDGLRRAVGRVETFTPERALARLDVAKRQVRRLEQLVGGLLDFSRISAGRLTLDLARVSLSSVLAEVIARLGDDIAAAGCTVKVREGGDLVGRWDPMRLDQVISNLVSNAVKYGAGKPIEIEATRIGEAVRLTVIDHGIGIADDAKARIFERFERAVSSAHYSGFGIGLWIVRHIVERLGGTIGVRSEPGGGATFVVELPVSGPELPEVSPGSPSGGSAGE